MVGYRMRAIRRRRGLTQAALAERAGLSPETVSALERGKHAPRADSLAALARALGCPPEQLLGLDAGVETGSGAPPGSPRREARIAEILAILRTLDDRNLDLARRLLAVLAEEEPAC